MKKTIRGVDGKEIELSDIKFLREKILLPQKEDWLYGSGDVGIYRYEDTMVACLILVYCEVKNAFFVQLYPQKNPEDWPVAVSNSDSKKEVPVYFGGNEYMIPEYVLISLEDTWDIVKYFFDHGGCSNSVKWLKYWEIDWPLIGEEE